MRSVAEWRRCLPCVMIFAFPAAMGRAPEGPALLLLLLLLVAAAFLSTLPTANVGAVLLNVNTSEVSILSPRVSCVMFLIFFVRYE